MKKIIISTFAISILALPLSSHADPAKHAAEQAIAGKPHAAMKSTMASPSKSAPPSSKVLDLTSKAQKKTRAIREESESTQKMLADVEKMGKNKGAGQKK